MKRNDRRWRKICYYHSVYLTVTDCKTTQCLCIVKESSDTLLHDVEDMWPDALTVIERLDDLADLLIKHLKSVARTRMITYCHLLRDFRPFLRNNLWVPLREHYYDRRAYTRIKRNCHVQITSRKTIGFQCETCRRTRTALRARIVSRPMFYQAIFLLLII